MSPLASLFDRALPLNRKERFYTGTVLPALVAADGFAHFHRFAELVDAGPVEVRADPGDCTIQFLPEYCFADSAVGSAGERFAGKPTARDTPDTVVYVSEPRPTLIVIEAKVYDRVTAARLDAQLLVQRRLIIYLADVLGVADANVHHVALLPAALAAEVGTLVCPVVTWEAVLAAYVDVAPAYWCEMLRLALDRYGDLRGAGSTASFGANAHVKLPGAEIVRRWEAGDQSVLAVGRQSGLHGAALADDVRTGRWRTQRYECRNDGPTGRPNWFPVAAFVDAVTVGITA